MKNAIAWWGLTVVLCGASAQAAPPVGAGGVGGAAPAAPAGGVSPAPSSLPAPAPTTNQSPPPSAAEPPDYALPPAAETPPSSVAAKPRGELELSEELEAARRRRERRRQLWLEEEEEREQEARVRRRRIRRDLAGTYEEPRPWRLVAPHFLVGVERVTNWLSWDRTETVQLATSGAGTNDAEVRSSGTDVSFLGSGGQSQNVFGVPRLAFDGMFESGLTLGGSLSYMTVGGKTETPTSGGGRVVRDDPTASIFVLAARAGVVLPASKLVGVWLRGGFSRISRSTDAKVESNSGATTTITTTSTLVNVTLDPQLIINPLPHVGITLGALLDIPLGGSLESTNLAAKRDVTASAYGATSGLLAIF